MKKTLFTIGIAATAVLYSCSPATTEAAAEDAVDAVEMSETVSSGKTVYQNDCTKCHGAKVIDKYSKEQWDKILPNMIKKAELGETAAAQVSAYVYWELEN